MVFRELSGSCCRGFPPTGAGWQADPSALPAVGDPLEKREGPPGAPARFGGSFPPIHRFEKFEIHKGYLHFPNLALTKNLSPNLLVELCVAALNFPNFATNSLQIRLHL